MPLYSGGSGARAPDRWRLRAALAPTGRRDGAVRLPRVLLLAERLPLVVLLLALRERDLDLDPAVLEVQRERHDRVARLLRLRLQLVDLGPVQQQLPLPLGRVVGPGALDVLGYVDVVVPRLVVV